MKPPVSPPKTAPPVAIPVEAEAFGIMIQARTQREAELTMALVQANRRIAELEAGQADVKSG